MTVIKATKKPVTIECIKWDGNNGDEVQRFIDNNGFVKGLYVDIGTKEGLKVASIGDYIIKDENCEFYPCKPEIFHMKYDIEGENK